MAFNNHQLESALIALSMYKYDESIGDVIHTDDIKKRIRIRINSKDFDIQYGWPFTDDDYFHDVGVLDSIENFYKKYTDSY